MPSTEALFGRAAELAWLLDRLSSAVAGRSSLVLVVGEAGIGKSRLVDEVARIARARAVRVLRSDATPSDSAPLALWTGITRGAHLDRATAVGLDRRWEILEGIAANLIAAAPAVVVLEDVHWADESSIWLLERIVGALAEAPVLLLVTARRHEPGTADLSSVRRGADVLELTGLDLASTIELVEARSERGASEAEDLWTLDRGQPTLRARAARVPSRARSHPPRGVRAAGSGPRRSASRVARGVGRAGGHRRIDTTRCAGKSPRPSQR